MPICEGVRHYQGFLCVTCGPWKSVVNGILPPIMLLNAGLGATALPEAPIQPDEHLEMIFVSRMIPRPCFDQRIS
jgi:hypothetical protein